MTLPQVNGNWAGLMYEAMKGGTMYRPKPQYSDWMTGAAEGTNPPVAPTDTELTLLREVSEKLLAKAQKDKHLLEDFAAAEEVGGAVAEEVGEQEEEEALEADDEEEGDIDEGGLGGGRSEPPAGESRAEVAPRADAAPAATAGATESKAAAAGAKAAVTAGGGKRKATTAATAPPSEQGTEKTGGGAATGGGKRSRSGTS